MASDISLLMEKLQANQQLPDDLVVITANEFERPAAELKTAVQLIERAGYKKHPTFETIQDAIRWYDSQAQEHPKKR